eukprot:299440-Prorocentrum_minimum.AAC.7
MLHAAGSEENLLGAGYGGAGSPIQAMARGGGQGGQGATGGGKLTNSIELGFYLVRVGGCACQCFTSEHTSTAHVSKSSKWPTPVLALRPSSCRPIGPAGSGDYRLQTTYTLHPAAYTRDKGSTRTNQTQEAWVYSHGGPIGRRKPYSRAPRGRCRIDREALIKAPCHWWRIQFSRRFFTGAVCPCRALVEQIWGVFAHTTWTNRVRGGGGPRTCRGGVQPFVVPASCTCGNSEEGGGWWGLGRCLLWCDTGGGTASISTGWRSDWSANWPGRMALPKREAVVLAASLVTRESTVAPRLCSQAVRQPGSQAVRQSDSQSVSQSVRLSGSQAAVSQSAAVREYHVYSPLIGINPLKPANYYEVVFFSRRLLRVLRSVAAQKEARPR